MPKLTYRIDADAKPEAAFAYVSDLTRHGEWSSVKLEITPASDGAAGVGKEYHSVAHAPSAVKAELKVTQYQPPSTFAFLGKDLSGSFEHVFTITPRDGGCTIERKVDFKTSPLFTVLVPVLYLLMGKRMDVNAMKRLKERLEAKQSTLQARGW